MPMIIQCEVPGCTGSAYYEAKTYSKNTPIKVCTEHADQMRKAGWPVKRLPSDESSQLMGGGQPIAKPDAIASFHVEPNARKRWPDTVPQHYQRMLFEALNIPIDGSLRARLLELAQTIFVVAWERFIEGRFIQPSDNHCCHELIVLGNGCRIRQSMDETRQRVGLITDLLHDACPLNRAGITEADGKHLEGPTRKIWEAERNIRRMEHMTKGAEVAVNILGKIREQFGKDFVHSDEMEQVRVLIENHDRVKLDEPYPDATNELAVACFEADQLFLVHPVGLLADMDRGPSDQRCAFDPDHWDKQLTHNIGQFRKWKSILEKATNPGTFKGDTLFRTSAGYEIFLGWLRFWNRSAD